MTWSALPLKVTVTEGHQQGRPAQIGSAGDPRVVDHDVHGLVGIRLVDPPPGAVDSVAGDLGPSTAARLAREPDIVVTFAESVPFTSRPRYLDGGAAAYDDAHFYLADQRDSHVRVDFVTLGGQSAIVAPRSTTAIPLLVPIVALHLLHRDHVLLHSSAFRYQGVTTLVAGWKKGGKTEILLPFLANGAEYLSDEWTIVSAAGTVRGLSADLHIWNWHAEQFPEIWSRLPLSARRRFRALRHYQRLAARSRRLSAHQGLLARQLARVARVGGAASVGQVRMAPEDLFDGRVCHEETDIGRLLLAGVGPATVDVRRVEPRLVAGRMVASLAFERLALLTAYDQFRFAFPDRRNELIESARDRELEILSRAFAGRPAYEVVHPYPMRLGDLFDQLQQVCGS